jgi:ribonuclease HII
MVPRHKFDLSLLPESPDLTFEQRLWGMGVRFVAGVDEAGRGALAGPVAAGAVVLPWEDDCLIENLEGVRDSKVMTAKARTHWAEVIKRTALAWGVGFASAQEIDRMGILPATRLAATRALAGLDMSVEHVLIDYLVLPEVEILQTSLVKGDAQSLSIACASVLATTARDAVLVWMEKTYPG